MFPCNQTLTKDTDIVEVCTGYVQSLIKSGVPPKNKAMYHFMSKVKEIDPRIMTIEETTKYHKKVPE